MMRNTKWLCWSLGRTVVGTVSPLTRPRDWDQPVDEVLPALPPAPPHGPADPGGAAAAEAGHTEADLQRALGQAGVLPGQPDDPAGAALPPPGGRRAVRQPRPCRAQEPEPALLQPAVAVVANSGLGRSPANESPVVGELLVVTTGRVVSRPNTQSGAQSLSCSQVDEESYNHDDEADDTDDDDAAQDGAGEVAPLTGALLVTLSIINQEVPGQSWLGDDARVAVVVWSLVLRGVWPGLRVTMVAWWISRIEGDVVVGFAGLLLLSFLQHWMEFSSVTKIISQVVFQFIISSLAMMIITIQVVKIPHYIWVCLKVTLLS